MTKKAPIPHRAGHAQCTPEHCIVHCPDALRDPTDWRRLARPLHTTQAEAAIAKVTGENGD